MASLKKKGVSVHDHDKGASRGGTLEGTDLATTGISRSYREPGPGGAGSASAEPGCPLPAALLYRRCDSTDLPFELVSELGDPSGPIGQDRAVEAVEFAVQMRRKGYNIYALGPSGTGKHTVIEDLLRQRANSMPTPPDWCYVNNFADPQKPRRLQLPPGRATGLRSDEAASRGIACCATGGLRTRRLPGAPRGYRSAVQRAQRAGIWRASAACRAKRHRHAAHADGTGPGAAARRQGIDAGDVRRPARGGAGADPARSGRSAGRARSGNAKGSAMGARAP